ncbi:MAG TPA: hypothetical protein VHZ78_00810 [Rhizomicrobium sp.]|jgi:hypothetical protein|nr:hypothetical protein [Rhizomicrobium sp.]
MFSYLTLENILSHKFIILCVVPVVVVYLVLTIVNLSRERAFSLRSFMVGSDMLLGTVAALAVQLITGIYTLQLTQLERMQLKHVPLHLFGSGIALIAVLPLLILCLSWERAAHEHRVERRFVALLVDIVAGALPLIATGYIAAVRSA